MKQKQHRKSPRTPTKLILQLLIITKLVNPFPSEGHCGIVYMDTGLKLFDGKANDPKVFSKANKCGGLNKFRVAILVWIIDLPLASGQKDIIFTYYDRLKIYLVTVGNNEYNLKVWKKNEPGDGIIHAFRVGAKDRWFMIWYEIDSTTSTIALRHAFPWSTEDYKKATATLSKSALIV